MGFCIHPPHAFEAHFSQSIVRLELSRGEPHLSIPFPMRPLIMGQGVSSRTPSIKLE